MVAEGQEQARDHADAPLRAAPGAEGSQEQVCRRAPDTADAPKLKMDPHPLTGDYVALVQWRAA